MKSLIVIVVLIIFVAVLTNPTQDEHREAVKNRLMAVLQKEIKNSSTNANEVGQAVGVMLGGLIANGLINNLISADNYVLFSITKMTWEGEERLLGIGAFGNVFFFNQFDETMPEGMMEEYQ